MQLLKKTVIAFVVLALVYFSFLIPKALAIQYDLIAPAGQLSRGQDVQFTINIDTEGKTLSSAIIGMTYVTEALQYISTTPGDSFPSVETETQENGRLIFRASNPNGFSGTGVFAIVTFKLITEVPGSAELCVLFNPEDTTLTPTTSTLAPPPPTTLPKTGSTTQTSKGIFLGIILFTLAGGLLFYLNKKGYETPRHLRSPHKTLH